MRNICITIAYDGTEYSGWQRQRSRPTIQQAVEEALFEITGTAATLHASGRTDAGVHALGQVAHFLTAATHDPATFVKALNATLPGDIRILAAREMPESFHATVDATSKMYRYVIDNGRVADAFLRRYAWHVFRLLDADAMRAAAQALVGRHDFRSFETDWPNRMSSVRTVASVNVERAGDAIRVEVEADGFLYNMVRAIAGTLTLVGKGKWPVERVAAALAAQDRREAGPTAPAQGLFLVRVEYPAHLFQREDL